MGTLLCGYTPAADFDSRAGLCGPLQIRGTLAAYGVDIPVADLEARLYQSAFHRRHDVMLPWNVVAILKKFNIASRLRFSPWNRIGMDFRHSLEAGHPVILLIQATRRRHRIHWISVWGMRDEDYCVYDSQYEKGDDLSIPVGNALYTLDILLNHLPKLFFGQGTCWIEVLGR